MTEKIEFEKVLINFKDCQNGIRLRTIKSSTDFKNYYLKFSNDIMRKKQSKIGEENVDNLMKNNGSLNLVIEDLKEEFLGIIEIRNLSKIFTGKVLISFLDSDKLDRYEIKVVSALLELVEITEMYKELRICLIARKSYYYIVKTINKIRINN